MLIHRLQCDLQVFKFVRQSTLLRFQSVLTRGRSLLSKYELVVQVFLPLLQMSILELELHNKLQVSTFQIFQRSFFLRVSYRLIRIRQVLVQFVKLFMPFF